MRRTRRLGLLAAFALPVLAMGVFAAIATAGSSGLGNGETGSNELPAFCVDHTITVLPGSGKTFGKTYDELAWAQDKRGGFWPDNGGDFITVDLGACPTPEPTPSPVTTTAPAKPKPQGPDRFGYCSVAGNSDLAGNPIVPGTFLPLLLGQPDTDKHYTGATPGFWVEGLGATCTLTPAQAALAAASTVKVNHVGTRGDYNLPEFYTFIPKG